MTTRTFTLFELNNHVRAAIETAMADDYWVEAELSEIHVRGHCYMDLVEHDAFSNTPVAKARAVCWASRWAVLGDKFTRVTGQPLQAGMKVLVRVTATFHEAYGFSYQVSDIDPGYTLGDIARRRMEIVRQLKEEGVFELQKELQLPVFAQRIAVISSATAAGYGDFRHQLAENSLGLAFSVKLFPAVMQGEQVEASVIAALDRINEHIGDFDVVVIIRGGGATADMTGFDTLRLAENVANFPLPVITGIGHERDECILDMVAHLCVKTPTAAAAFLIEHLGGALSALAVMKERVAKLANQRLNYELVRLGRVKDRFPALFSLYHLRQTMRIESLSGRMKTAAARQIDKETDRLAMIRQRMTALDPANMLRRGYSITLCDGRAVRSAAEVADGSMIETILEKGTLKSEIRK